MKGVILLLAVAVNALAGATNEVPGAAEQKRMFMEAVLQNQHGQYAEAEAQLKQLAVLQPNDAQIKELLGQVQGKLKAQEADPVNVLKRRLTEIVFPLVTFRYASPRDVIDYLDQEGRKLSSDKTPINFVWLVPDDPELKPVTLQLRNAPLSDILGYVTQLAGLKYRVEPHAVVIFKTEPASAPNAKP